MKNRGATLKRRRLVDDMTAHIAVSIFKGTYPPGSSLPPIRALADGYEVTIATAQRVVARLEEMGLITVRHGSGMLVQDPKHGVAPSAMPYWFEALEDNPSRSAEILGDFFEARRVLAVDVLMRVRQKGEAVVFSEPGLQHLLNALEECGAPDPDAGRAVELDMQITRLLLAVRRNVAYTTVFHMLERLIMELPDLQLAMYSNPAENAAGYRKVVKLLLSCLPDEEVRHRIEETIAEDDGRKIDRFRRRLESKRTGNPPREVPL